MIKISTFILDKHEKVENLRVLQDTLIIFWLNNVSVLVNGWFGTSINQENQFQSIPPYFMALATTENLGGICHERIIKH